MHPSELFNSLTNNGVGFFTGVPDSLLKNFCVYITDNTNDNNHMIAANEGAAIALATGYHLSTGKLPLVYMQNSGLGNTINPILSLADKEVYAIPMILIIGWRGEPGVKDEPQHIKQGKVQNAILDAIEIPYYNGLPDKSLFKKHITISQYNSLISELLDLLKVNSIIEASDKLKNMLISADLATTLKGIGAKSKNEIIALCQTVNIERLNNNPVKITQRDITNMLLKIY